MWRPLCGFYYSIRPFSSAKHLRLWSLRMALASIWRTRSRVTPKSRPTSSSVRGRPSSRPKRRRMTFSSRGSQALESLIDLLGHHGAVRSLAGSLGVLVGDEIAQRGVLLLADGALKLAGGSSTKRPTNCAHHAE